MSTGVHGSDKVRAVRLGCHLLNFVLLVVFSNIAVLGLHRIRGFYRFNELYLIL